MRKRTRDRVLLLLAIKPPEKTVDFEHIYEKVKRDCGASREEIKQALDELIAEGLAKRVENNFAITEEGRKAAWDLAFDPEMNRSYRLVYVARWYYRYVEDLILPFIVNRPVSLVKVFSDESDPIGKVKPIFSRYAKQKPKQYNYIYNKRDLWRYINAHAIDFIPYVHADINAKYPDWFIIDIDAGEELKSAENGFKLIKEVTLEVYLVLYEEFDVKSCIKFSGGRGFQIWTTFDQPLGKFDAYRDAIKLIQKLVEQRLEEKYYEFREKYGAIFDTPITTSDVAHADRRKRRILLDWSSLKPEGDVRAPWSIHWKTGLISVPVDPHQILDFDIEQADPRMVVENLNKLKHLFELPISSSAMLRKALKPSLDLFFG